MQRSSRTYQRIRVETSGAVARLVLDRGDGLNAVDLVLADELLDYFRGLEHDDSVRVVVMQSIGKHFCVGFDLNHVDKMYATTITNTLRRQRAIAAVVVAMRRCPQPIIALVQGAAAGAGFALALAADVRYAADDARMNVAMSKLGLTGCDMGISYFLPRAVGTSNAAELMMTGRFVTADRALRIGLVSEVVPRDRLAQVGDELARDMLAMSPMGLRLTKDGLNSAQDAGSLEAVIALEDRGQALTIQSFMKEGVEAFRQRREPRYSDD